MPLFQEDLIDLGLDGRVYVFIIGDEGFAEGDGAFGKVKGNHELEDYSN